MKTKAIHNILPRVCLLLMVLLSLGVLAGCEQKKDLTSVRVGVILNLTGSAANVDGPKRRAMELANEFLHQQAVPTSPKIELIFEDGKSAAKEAITAYNNLMRQGVRIFLVGSSLSAMPVCPINKNAGNLLFGVSGHPDFTATGGLTVRCYPNVEQSANLIVRSLIPDDSKAVYILHMEEPWTKSYSDAIRAKLKDRVRLFEDAYPVGSQDFNDIVARIRQTNPDHIVLLDYGTSMQAIVRSLIQNQVKAALIGCETSFVANLPSLSGFDAARFLFLSTDYTEKAAAGRHEFANYYRQREQGALPPYYAVFCADGLEILFEVLKEHPEAAENPKALHDAIVNKRLFNAFSGSLDVKATGDVDYPINIYRYDKGLPVRVVMGK